MKGGFISPLQQLLLVNLKLGYRIRTCTMLSIGLSSLSNHHGQTQGQIQLFWLATPTSHLIVDMGGGGGGALKRMADGKPSPCPQTKKGTTTTTALNNPASCILFQAYRDIITCIVVMLSVVAVNLKCKWCKVLELSGRT